MTIGSEIGTILSQLIELLNRRGKRYLTIDGGILIIGCLVNLATILTTEIDSLLIHAGSIATSIAKSIDITSQHVSGRRLQLDAIVSIDARIDGILRLCLIEGATDTNDHLGILLVLLVDGIHLLHHIRSLTLDNLFGSIDSGLSLLGCDGSAEAEHHSSHEKVFHCFHNLSYLFLVNN